MFGVRGDERVFVIVEDELSPAAEAAGESIPIYQQAMLMNSEKISKYRSEVIERTINIEWIVGAIICQHYFKRVDKHFLLEVLYDENFNFGLKRRILEKIVQNIDPKKVQELNRLGKIRNYFAHCNQVIIDITDPANHETVVDPRNLDKALDFERLYNEFMGIVGEVEEYIFSIFRQKGGVDVRENDFMNRFESK